MTMEVVKVLGKGCFGSVDLVKYTQSNGDFWYSARKSSSWPDNDYLIKEFNILCKFRRCIGIVQCFGNTLEEDFMKNGTKICRMSMEYARGGNLYSLMDSQIDRRLPDNMIRQFTRTILQGLVSVHSCGYIHCDLKPENILVFPDFIYENGVKKTIYKVKMTDFGLAREINEKDDWWAPYYPFWATPLYMSPESVGEGEIGTALDIWSLGCIVLEMYTGQPPWPGKMTIEELIGSLRAGFAPEIPKTLPWDARMFLKTCFSRNPKERLNALVLLSHPFVVQEKTTLDVVRRFLTASRECLESRVQLERTPMLLIYSPRVPPGFHRKAN